MSKLIRLSNSHTHMRIVSKTDKDQNGRFSYIVECAQGVQYSVKLRASIIGSWVSSRYVFQSLAISERREDLEGQGNFYLNPFIAMTSVMIPLIAPNYE